MRPRLRSLTIDYRSHRAIVERHERWMASKRKAWSPPITQPGARCAPSYRGAKPVSTVAVRKAKLPWLASSLWPVPEDAESKFPALPSRRPFDPIVELTLPHTPAGRSHHLNCYYGLLVEADVIRLVASRRR